MSALTPFSWFTAALAGPGGGWLWLGLASLGVLALLVWVLARLAPAPGASLVQRWRDTQESGVATVEFVLVFPIVMFLGMLLLQITLAMVGNAYVNYAAFAATRAAIVQIPADHGDPSEPHNVIFATRGFEKFDRIHAAAAFAVMPVSGRLEGSAFPGDRVRDGMDNLFASQGRSSPNWVASMVEQRVHYAAENTEVTLLEALPSGSNVSFNTIFSSYAYAPRESVTVQVSHRLNLAVPYVRGIFADGEHTTADGPGAYTLVTASATLTNEGVNPDLPPLPILPRHPQ